MKKARLSSCVHKVPSITMLCTFGPSKLYLCNYVRTLYILVKLFKSCLKIFAPLVRDIGVLVDSVVCYFRKDSEQTKQIEDLQKQNEELLDEKECLVEEINRIMSETGKI